MKTYGILGILWLVSGCCAAYININDILFVMGTPIQPGSKAYHYVWWHGCLVMKDLLVIVASLFVTRGDPWARWFLGTLAILSVIGTVAAMGVSFSITYVIFGVFAFVSAILLLKPRRSGAA